MVEESMIASLIHPCVSWYMSIAIDMRGVLDICVLTSCGIILPMRFIVPCSLRS